LEQCVAAARMASKATVQARSLGKLGPCALEKIAAATCRRQVRLEGRVA
jgi:hypothetical protein